MKCAMLWIILLKLFEQFFLAMHGLCIFSASNLSSS